MTSIAHLYGAVRGIGNPITGTRTSARPPAPPADAKQELALFETDGWLKKTFLYRHECMVNLDSVTRQLEDDKPLANLMLLKHRQQYLIDEINVCHKMLSLFSKELL